MKLGPVVETDRGGDYVTVEFVLESVSVKVTIREVQGLPQIVGLDIGQPVPSSPEFQFLDKLVGDEPTVITSDLLKSIPLRQLKEIFYAKREKGSRSFKVLNVSKRVGPAPLPVAFLESVAGVYSDAVRNGKAPRKAVEEKFGVAPSTASKYIDRARNSDPPLLPKAIGQGKPGPAAPVKPQKSRKPVKTRGKGITQ